MRGRIDLSPAENDQRAAILGIGKGIIDKKILATLTQIINAAVDWDGVVERVKKDTLIAYHEMGR